MDPVNAPFLCVQSSNEDETNNTVATTKEPNEVVQTAQVVISHSSPPLSPIDSRSWSLTAQKIRERAKKTDQFRRQNAKFLTIMQKISEKIGASEPSAILDLMRKRNLLQAEAKEKELATIDYASLGELGETFRHIDNNRKALTQSNGLIKFLEECSNINVDHLTSLENLLSVMWEGRRKYNFVLFSMSPYHQFGIKYRLDELIEIKCRMDPSTPRVTETPQMGEQVDRTGFCPLIDHLVLLVSMKEELSCLDYALANNLIKEPLMQAYKERIKGKHYDTFQRIEKELDSNETLATANQSASTEEKLVAEQIIRRTKEVRNLFASLNLASVEPSSTETPELIEVLNELETGYAFKAEWDANLHLLCRIVELKERLWARSILKLPIEEADRDTYLKLIEEATTLGEQLSGLRKAIAESIYRETEDFKAVKDPHVKIQAIWDKIFKLEKDAESSEQQPAKKTWFGYFGF